MAVASEWGQNGLLYCTNHPALKGGRQVIVVHHFHRVVKLELNGTHLGRFARADRVAIMVRTNVHTLMIALAKVGPFVLVG